MLTERDKQRLVGVHTDLVRLVEAADAAGVKFAVIEGVRTLERQKKLFAERKTQTMRSRHLTGHAVDLAPLADTDGDGDAEISWYWPDYYAMAPKIKAIADEIGVRVEWGGDWKTLKDGPHWQIPWDATPSVAPAKTMVAEGDDTPVSAPRTAIEAITAKTTSPLKKGWFTSEFLVAAVAIIGPGILAMADSAASFSPALKDSVWVAMAYVIGRSLVKAATMLPVKPPAVEVEVK